MIEKNLIKIKSSTSIYKIQLISYLTVKIFISLIKFLIITKGLLDRNYHEASI